VEKQDSTRKTPIPAITRICKEASNMCLHKGQLYAETEGFATATQDQVINTRNYLKHVIKDNNVADNK
jgi:hypothetical protein